MEIVIKNNNLVEFGTVPRGKVFRIDYGEGGIPTYGMKTESVESTSFDISTPLNSVDLNDGSLFWVGDGALVAVCHTAKLIIE